MGMEDLARLDSARIQESIDHLIRVCDATGCHLDASETFLRLVGITQEQSEVPAGVGCVLSKPPRLPQSCKAPAAIVQNEEQR
jgi:NADH:ubiquinone oxidoreductase subunit E